MSGPTDDLDAVRTLIDTLSQFERTDQERIMRWACEKLDLPHGQIQVQEKPPLDPSEDKPPPPVQPSGGTDIRTFVRAKDPSSDNQLAAVVAYYYRFEAQEHERKLAITSEDLQEACRLAGRERLTNPGKTLGNAHGVGWLDKTGDRGTYAINTIGENLVAMTLPGGSGQANPARRKSKAKKKTAKKKTTKTKVSNK